MKTRYWLPIAVLFIAAAGIYWFCMIPATVHPAGAQSQARFQPGPYAVITETLDLLDTARDTPRNRDLPGHPGRELKGTLWRPDGLQQAGPLVVHSHGFTSTHIEALYLARFLASHGYTVAAVDYPLTSYGTPGEPLVTDVVNQPGDVSFLIDTLLQRSASEGDTLFASIDPRRIALSGISLGGLTTTLATFHPRMRDPRIRAAISIAGPSSMLLPGFFAGEDTPYLAIYGDHDVVVPYPANGAPLPEKNPDTVLVTLLGGSHAGFLQLGATMMRFMGNPDTLGCHFVLAGLENGEAAEDQQFVGILGNASEGIDDGAEVDICSTPPPPVTMASARQHMFTILAAYSFLESVFDTSGESRRSARDYLVQTLAGENTGEVTVAAPAATQGMAAALSGR
ncbi:alpha/beta hydrolase family protein [Haliea sp. E17]|uniref:alpha/beta hydrolase family protein n=1 Tax=Haliea sp. E17 TaxID=3401576 RepID=UPI003AABB6A9